MDEVIVIWHEKPRNADEALVKAIESILEQGGVSLLLPPEGKHSSSFTAMAFSRKIVTKDGLKEAREEIVRALGKGEITVVDLPEIYELFIKLANWLKERVICREDIEKCSNSIYRNIYRLVRSERIMCDKIVGVSGYYEGKKKKADN